MSDYDFRRNNSSRDQEAANQTRPSTPPQIWALCPDCHAKVVDLGYSLIPTRTPERMGRCSLHPIATVCLVKNYINQGKRSYSPAARKESR